jgi:hypothetical protein
MITLSNQKLFGKGDASASLLAVALTLTGTPKKTGKTTRLRVL